MTVEINYLAIIAAAAVSMAIGFAWYGPLFGKVWVKLVGISEKDMQQSSTMPMVLMVIFSLLRAFILRHFVVYSTYFYPSYSKLSVGLITGFWVWLGFVFTAIAGAYVFAQRRKKLIIIDTGYNLVNLLAIGALLAVWS